MCCGMHCPANDQNKRNLLEFYDIAFLCIESELNNNGKIDQKTSKNY